MNGQQQIHVSIERLPYRHEPKICSPPCALLKLHGPPAVLMYAYFPSVKPHARWLASNVASGPSHFQQLLPWFPSECQRQEIRSCSVDAKAWFVLEDQLRKSDFGKFYDDSGDLGWSRWTTGIRPPRLPTHLYRLTKRMVDCTTAATKEYILCLVTR